VLYLVLAESRIDDVLVGFIPIALCSTKELADKVSEYQVRYLRQRSRYLKIVPVTVDDTKTIDYWS